MVIKASAAAEIRALVAALAGPDEVRRDAAIARLAVIGPRAVDRLIAAYDAADRGTRVAILRALEPSGDPRVLPLARIAIAHGADEGIAAANVLRGLLDSPQSAVSAGALDALVTAALDRALDRRVRRSAFDALPRRPPEVRARVLAAFGDDAALNPPAGAGGTAPPDRAADDALWGDALEGRLPDEPAGLRKALSTRGAAAPLSALRRLIDAVRAREEQGHAAARRQEWRALRGAVHQTLALRDSRIALYDLRESLERASEPLPVSFLSSLHAVGDASCLEPIAAALGRAAPEDTWWRQQLVSAFHAVARRERITRKHAAMKRALARCPELAAR